MFQHYNPNPAQSSSVPLKSKSPLFDCFSDDSDDFNLVPAPPTNPKCIPKIQQILYPSLDPIPTPLFNNFPDSAAPMPVPAFLPVTI